MLVNEVIDKARRKTRKCRIYKVDYYAHNTKTFELLSKYNTTKKIDFFIDKICV